MKKFIVLFIGVITLLFATNVKASKIELPEKQTMKRSKYIYSVEQDVHIAMIF